MGASSPRLLQGSAGALDSSRSSLGPTAHSGCCTLKAAVAAEVSVLPRAAPPPATQTYTLDVHGPHETATLVFYKALSLEALLARVHEAFRDTLWSRFTLTWESEGDVQQAFEVGRLAARPGALLGPCLPCCMVQHRCGQRAVRAPPVLHHQCASGLSGSGWWTQAR